MKNYKKYFDLIQSSGFSVGKEKGKLKPCSQINCGKCEFNMFNCSEELLNYLLEDVIEEINLYDIVEVINNCESYTSNIEWVEKNISSLRHRYYYDINHLPTNGMRCKVMHKSEALHTNEMLYYVEDLVSNRYYLLSEKGIKKVQ